MKRRGAVPTCIWVTITFLAIGFIIRVIATVIDVSSQVYGIYAFTIALGYACLWLIVDFLLFPFPCIFFRFIIPKKRMLGWRSYIVVGFYFIVAVVVKLIIQKYFYFDDIWFMEYAELLWIKINTPIIQCMGGRTLYSSWYGMNYDELFKNKIEAENILKCVDTNEAYIDKTLPHGGAARQFL